MDRGGGGRGFPALIEKIYKQPAHHQGGFRHYSIGVYISA
jgi:hypothetical protein